MALTCDDLRRLIDEEEPLDTAGAREHLDGCPECRTIVRRWTQVTAELTDIAGEPPPAFLHGRVMAHVRTARAAPKRLWWAPALATALLVAVVGLWRPPFPSTQPSRSPSSAPTPSWSASSSALSTAPVSPGLQPPSVAPDPLRGAPTPREAAVPCVVVASDGKSRPLSLPEALAPVQKSEWAVVVAPSGEVRPEDEAMAIPFETLEILAGADLPAGRHVLRRAPHAKR